MPEKSTQIGVSVKTQGLKEFQSSIEQIVQTAKTLAASGSDFHTLSQTMNMLLEGTGKNTIGFLEELRKQTRGTLPDLDLLQKAIQLRGAGASVEQIPKLIDFANTRAKTLGKSFDSIVDAFAKVSGSTGQDLAKELLIPVDVQTSLEQFANKYKGHANQLTEVGQRHAFYNAILSDEVKNQDRLQKINLESSETMDRFSTAIANLKNSTGTVFEDLIKRMTVGIQGLNSFNNLLLSNEDFKQRMSNVKESGNQILGIGWKIQEVAKEGTAAIKQQGDALISYDKVAGNKTKQKSKLSQTGSIIKESFSAGQSTAVSFPLLSNEVNPLTVKSASDIANQISTALKPPILATVALKKGLKETGEQSKQTFTTMSHDASKAGMSLATISNTGAMVGKAIAQGLESSTGQLKAALKNILTLFLDFLKKGRLSLLPRWVLCVVIPQT